ncbi:MFS transporter [Tetzosporium hominis]|uniref:MFS transporter n=1 Tax=Tetzosporium hominis TaxID=2020506 RepID=A0A264W042_9BACL|nr:MFS transporter [Tetzosporium hominis]OZS76923.1 MFS transporter [Tetzosporium hominis]
MKNKTGLTKNRSFLAVWIGNGASELGGAFGTFCNSILVYQLTGSGIALGSMWVLYYVPSLLLQLVIGPFIDRWSKKEIMIFSQWTRALLFLILLGLLFTNELEVWHIYGVQLVIGLSTPLYVPANQAILPTLVSRDDLPHANAYIESTMRLMSFLAPILAGIIIEAAGIRETLIFTSILLFTSGLAICSVSVKRETVDSRVSWLVELKEGYTTFFRNPVLLWLGIFLGFVQFGVGVTLVTTLPYITSELKGSYAHYGYFMAGFPMGYIVGALIATNIPKENRQRLMLGALCIGGTTFIALYFINSIPLAIFTEAIGGMVMAIFSIHNLTLFQEIVANNQLGRVASVRLLLIRSFMLLGIVSGGLLSEVWGIRPLYLFIGTIICVTSVIGLIHPYFRFLNGSKLSIRKSEMKQG